MKPRFVAISALLLVCLCPVALSENRVQLTFDDSEADQVLAILALRQQQTSPTASGWQKLFATEPYRRLKRREEEIGRQFSDPTRAFTDDDFKQFVLSDDLLRHAPALKTTLDNWKKADLQAAATRILQYLPQSAVIRAKVYPMIKPRTNSFVFEPESDAAIFLYLDPAISAAKFENTVAHELHHVGLASLGAQYDSKIASLPELPRTAAEWMASFGEGLAMLAAAGGPDVDPHAASSPEEHARWDRDLANFNHDLPEVNAFFLDVLDGKFANKDAIAERASSFFGVQGPWYTVGYRMAVMVEKRFGREALIQTMLDPRRLLTLYNRAAAGRNALGGQQLPLWSEDLLKQVQAQ